MLGPMQNNYRDLRKNYTIAYGDQTLFGERLQYAMQLAQDPTPRAKLA
jgi:hypothetical protein